ncbi:MAG: dephospho-CoA kinase [Actinomycetes bacterium]
MLKVGLTGGIGSGKSEVARLLASYGAVLVDADVLAREVVAPGTPGLAAVVEAFGDAVLGPDGSLDRPALGAIVFSDEEARGRLNAIVHPLVGRRAAEIMADAPAGAVVVHDVPLLVENGLQDAYDVVVVVDADERTQVERLTAHRRMGEDEARARIAVQASRDQRRTVADVVIDNSGSLADLEHQVRDLWSTLTARVAAESGEGS